MATSRRQGVDDELDLVIELVVDGGVELRLRAAPRVRSPVIAIAWRELDRRRVDARGDHRALIERWAAGAARISVDLIHRYEPAIAAVAEEALHRAGANRPVVVHRFSTTAPPVPLRWPVAVAGSRLDDGPPVSVPAPLQRGAPGAAIHQIDPGLPFERALAELVGRAERPRLVVLRVPRTWFDRERRRVRVGEPGFEPLERWAVTSRVAELARCGCPAIIAVDERCDLYRHLAADCPLDEVARRLGPSCVMLAMIDGAEHAVSMRRALVEGTQLGRATTGPVVSLREILDRPLRRPRSELEALLVERAEAARDRLREDAGVLAAPATTVAPEQLSRLAASLDRTLRRGELALSWALTPPAEPHFGVPRGADPESIGVMSPRALHASVRRSSGELVEDGLAVQVEYQLQVSVEFVDRDQLVQIGAVVHELPELADLFGTERLELDVVVFALPEQFRVGSGRFVLELPRAGASGRVMIPIVPVSVPERRATAASSPPRRRLRVGLYHQTRLIQALAIDVVVTATAEDARHQAAPALALDYVASAELLTIDRGEAPRVSLWLNEGPDGTHLLGARFSDRDGADQPPITIHLVDPQLAPKLRRALDEFPHHFDLNDPDERAVVERAWVALARAGKQARATIFGSVQRSVQWDELVDRLRGVGALIEIARCRPDAPGIPWQLMYDPPVRSAGADVRLCPVFCERVLDRPPTVEPTCAGDPRCAHRELVTGATEPRSNAALDPQRTVCPFGFWGLRHRVTQPLAATSGRLGASDLDTGTGAPRVVVPYFQFKNAEQHIREISTIATRSGVRVWSSRVSDDVLAELSASAAVLYFYCHGLVDGELSTFTLRLGSKLDAENAIDAATLIDFVRKPRWAPHRPVVILNGCETLQIVPDRKEIHLFLEVLRALGAGAVIGTEVPMMTDIASRVGEALIDGILGGRPLEEVVLQMRRSVLAGLSGRGLAYNVYGPTGFTYRAPVPA